MSGGSANLNVQPSKEGGSHNMKVELISSARRTRGEEYKYIYDFGLRRTGDYLIDVKRDSQMWIEPKDVQLILECKTVSGQAIDYVEVKVDQSSDEHSAQILEGGIGQDYIKLLVKASGTYWFKYDARFFGVPNLARVKLVKD